MLRQLEPRMTKQRFVPRFRDGLIALLASWPAALDAPRVSPELAESVARASLGAIASLIVVWRDGMLSRVPAEMMAFDYVLAGLHAAARGARSVATAA